MTSADKHGSQDKGVRQTKALDEDLDSVDSDSASVDSDSHSDNNRARDQEQSPDDERFAVTDEIARGGMGRVLAARDRRLNRTVAVKEALASSPEALARFEREVLITAKLQHPGILPLYDVRTWPSGEPYYVMRLVRGEPLADKIASAGELDDRLTLLPSLQAAADAMAFAHEASIIHRDIKPSNILVGEHGETVVIDWGIAKVLDDEEPAATEESVNERFNETRVGAVLGTPGYMAPEQAAGDPATERSDVYALGACLYHLLAGERPFDEVDSDRIMAKQLEGPPRPLREVEKGVPRDLVAIVERALSYEPVQRYPNAAAFADDLRRFQTGQLVAAHEYTVTQRLRRFVSRHRALLLVVCFALLVVAVVIGSSRRKVQAERDNVLAASEREADRKDELVIVQARRLFDLGDATAAVAMLKTLPQDTRLLDDARELFGEAMRRGIRNEVGGPTTWAALAWHPSKPLLMAAGDRTVRIVEAQPSAAPIMRELVTFPAYIAGAVFIDGGRQIAVATKEAKLSIVDVETGAQKVIATKASLVAIAGPADGSFVALRDKEGGVWRYAVGDEALQFVGNAGAGDDLDVSADGAVIAAAGNWSSSVMWRDGERIEIPGDAWELSIVGQRLFALTRAAVLEYDTTPSGDSALRETNRFDVKDVTSVELDRRGRVYLAAQRRILRMDEDGPVTVSPSGYLFNASTSLASGGTDLVIRSPTHLALVDRAGRIDLRDDQPHITALATAFGVVAAGQLGGRISLYRHPEVTNRSVPIEGVSSSVYVGDDLFVIQGSVVSRHNRDDNTLVRVGEFEFAPIQLRPAPTGYLLNLAGERSQLMRLADGSVKPVSLGGAVVGFTAPAEISFALGSKIIRQRPFDAPAGKTEVEVGHEVNNFFVVDDKLFVGTADGYVIANVGDASEWKASIGGPVAALALEKDGVLLASTSNKLLRVTRASVEEVTTMAGRISLLSPSPNGVLMVGEGHVSSITGDEIRSVSVPPFSAFWRLQGKMLVQTSSRKLVIVDPSRQRSTSLATSHLDARRFVRAITTDGVGTVAIGYDDAIELVAVVPPTGSGKLHVQLERATSATLDAAGEQLIWP